MSKALAGGEAIVEAAKKKALSDLVEETNRPSHYTGGSIETRELIEALGYGEGYNRGCALKYIARAGKKTGAKAIADIIKARHYLAFEVERLALEDGSEMTLALAKEEVRAEDHRDTFHRLLK